MPSDERDRQFERALQRHLRASSADAACPDAEILAAYHERTLSLEEVAQWKEHIVACSRCQETLALVEETSPVALHEWEEKGVAQRTVFLGESQDRTAKFEAVQEESAYPAMESAISGSAPLSAKKDVTPSRWKWIVPAGALAAALLLFVAEREHKMERGAPPSVQVAQNRDSTAGIPNSQGIQSVPGPEANTLSKNDAIRDLGGKNIPTQSTGDSVAGLAVGASGTKKGGSSSEQMPVENYERERSAHGIMPPRTGPAAKFKVPPAVETNNPAAEEEAARVRYESMNQLAAGAAKVAPAAPPQSPEAKAGSLSGTGKMLNRAPTPRKPAQPSPGETSAALGAMAAAKSAELSTKSGDTVPTRNLPALDRSYIAAPGGKIIWRVGASGKIEVSADLGNSWTLQNSGVATDLTSGSAPSETVCWVVGKAGTVLLTTDGGATWRRIVTPSQEDLGGVNAKDAEHATVWADLFHAGLKYSMPRSSTGRTGFSTADGGVTWKPAKVNKN